jgi:hypothetical protein
MYSGKSASVVLAATALVLGILSWPMATIADQPQPKCEIQGTWMGYDENGLVLWTATFAGKSSSSGASILEAVSDLTFFGMFPDAERSNIGRGMWKKIDGRTIGNTVVGFVQDAAGNALYIWKLAAIDTIEPDCVTLSINSTIEYFYPDQNPFEDTPFYIFYSPPHTGMRMRVDPPVSP